MKILLIVTALALLLLVVFIVRIVTNPGRKLDKTLSVVIPLLCLVAFIVLYYMAKNSVATDASFEDACLRLICGTQS